MDEFFQRLREIQKKERSTSGLSDVGDNFYNEVNIQMNKLIKEIGDNPFSFYSYLLRDARRIASEICERREHKIITSALLIVQRSHSLFDENSSKGTPSQPPQNITSEEENLYYSIIKSFSNYRKDLASPFLKLKEKNGSKHSKEAKVDNSTQSSPKASIKSNEKKKVPLGIEHDIESYQAYEIPEMDEPQDIPEFIPEIAEEISKASNKDEIKTVMVLEELPSIMGIDKKIYGPLLPQDIVTMPEATARIIIENNKGKLIKKYEKIAYK
ncbi:MAG: hypothetical protein ACPK7O_01775 [Methanobacterium sp.]